MAKLTFVLEDDQEVEVPLPERLTIGREEDNDVVVDDERVSKHHAEVISLVGGRFEVRDLGSTAGTHVNGARLTGTRILRDGDRVEFGPLSGRFDAEGAEEPAPPATATRPVSLSGTKRVAVTTRPVPVPPPAAEAAPRHEPKPVSMAEMRKATAPTPAVPATPWPVPGPKAETVRPQPQSEPAQETKPDSAPTPSSDEKSLHADIERLRKEKARLEQEVMAAEETLEDWRMKSAKERNAHENRLSTLRSAEERLLPLQAAAKHAEKTHGDWLAAIQQLSIEHTEKAAALQQAADEQELRAAEVARLTEEAAATREEITSLASQQEEAAARLARLQEQCAQEEARLRQLEQDRVQGEARLQQINEEGAQETTRLQFAHQEQTARLHQEREQHAAALRQQRDEQEARLEALLRQQAEIEQSNLQAGTAAERITQVRAEQQAAEAELARMQEDLSRRERAVAEALQRLEDANAQVDESLARLAEVEAQRQSLALTDTQVADLNDGLVSLAQQHATAERQLMDTQTALAEVESRLAAQSSLLQNSAEAEHAARTRLGDLGAQEANLRAELTTLNATIQNHRATVEQIRRHAAEHEETKRAIEAAQAELAGLTARLTPLRDWKESMDQLYARFASVPQGTPQSQEIWREIEGGKATLIKHIMSLHTRVPRITHIEFSREGVKPGTPMKSERVRSKDGAK